MLDWRLLQSGKENENNMNKSTLVSLFFYSLPSCHIFESLWLNYLIQQGESRLWKSHSVNFTFFFKSDFQIFEKTLESCIISQN